MFRLSKEGKVEVLNKGSLNGSDVITLYLIGKLYAKEAGLTDSEAVSSKEFLDEIGILENSLWPWLKELRDDGVIKQLRVGRFRHHYIPINHVEKYLIEINDKLESMDDA